MFSRKIFSSHSSAKDGGWSWLILVASFLISAYTWGVQHVVGIIYNVLKDEFGASKTLVAWITSIPLFLLFFLAPLFTILSKKLNGVRILSFIGALCIGFSLIISSFVENIYVLFFTYSLLMGIGLLLLATPILIKVGEYFVKHKSLALAFVTIGSFISPLYLSPMLDHVISKYSWKTGFQILGAQVLLICCPAVFLWRNHTDVEKEKIKRQHSLIQNEVKNAVIENYFVQENKLEIRIDGNQNAEVIRESISGNSTAVTLPREQLNVQVQPSKDCNSKKANFKSLLRDKQFIILLVACFIGSLDWIVSHTHLVSYAIELGIPTSKANWLPTCSAAGNIVGRLFFGKLFDLHFIKTFTFYKALMFVAGVVSIFGAFGESFEYLAIYAVIQMALDGGHKSQMPTVVFDIVGKDRLMEGWTLIMFFQSFMLILGPSLVGILTDLTENYKVMFYFISGPPILASMILQSSIFLKKR